MSAVGSKEVTNKTISGIRLSFYSDEEVRKLSVRRITSPIIFDNFKSPLPNGLYDPAMGPLDQGSVCVTCGLGYTNCPGHFGHIELPVPVYNPLIFKDLYKLTRTVCMNCHCFKLNQAEVDRFCTKLQLLQNGQLVEALSVRTSMPQAKKGAAADDDKDDLAAQTSAAASAMAAAAAAKLKHGDAGVVTVHTVEAIRDTIGDFYKRVPPSRCQNCGASNPQVKRAGEMKLFQKWPSVKALTQNVMRGISLGTKVEDIGAEAAAELQRAARSSKKQRREAEERTWVDEEAGEGEDEEEEDEEEDDKEGKDEKKGGVGAQKSEVEELRDEDDMEEDGEGKEEKKADGAKAEVKKKGGAAARKRPREDAEEDDPVKRLLRPKYMDPIHVEGLLKGLWHTQGAMLACLFARDPSAAAAKSRKGAAPTPTSYTQFFLRSIPVAPNKFRPPSRMGEDMFEHPQNLTLQKVINAMLDITSEYKPRGPAAEGEEELTAEQLKFRKLDAFLGAWQRLQQGVCALIDSATLETKTDVMGIRQSLERKEGLFRKNMMGKRVNYAARSVISPDPYIGAGEIGVPPYFAKRLSFPEKVTEFNVEKLRAAVINGPQVHPGAVAVEDEKGRLVDLSRLDKQKREALAKQLLLRTGVGLQAPPGSRGRSLMTAGGTKTVYRHLVDGDLMLTNRQPTLHKPGLMAHRARVLKGERTIRMHYANCSTFNADFDGDEINLHLPQDHHGRAEGYNIVHADQQYIVPTDGKPLRGLIQDHVVAGVLLMKKDAFFTYAEYCQLCYIATTSSRPSAARTERALVLEPPTIFKPGPLWSGKQVVATVVRHFTHGLPPLTMSAGGKVPADYWGRDSGEGELVFYRGYCVCGTMDKNQYGKYGLVHAMHELYGPAVAGGITSAFSRLFTHYLQWHGFTCGFDDLMLIRSAEAERLRIIRRAEFEALKASATLVGASLPATLAHATPEQLTKAAVRVEKLLAERYRSNTATGAAHDMKVSGVMHPLSSEVVKACLPNAQKKPFPTNCLSLMTVSGAKGSLVNFSQISCLLGQQELEGRRVPRMSSGSTLPCFRPYDAGARSGGYIGDRFLAGLRPQEYYFHCMAGREGLVDTAVKTSRSGYLQRCMIKNLETLRVQYDCTVRDNADGSIIQFQYGEDGLDVTTTSHLRKFAFLAHNAQRFAQQLDLPAARAAGQAADLAAQEAEVQRQLDKRQKLLAKAKAKGKSESTATAKLLPVSGQMFPTVLGCTSESFADALSAYVEANPDGLLRPADPEEGAEAGRKVKKQRQRLVQPRPAGNVAADEFEALMRLKYLKSLAAPGEAVGVLAGQSIGEPSTQMTLNTFHMAGRGEANVTLGIPRLREILMTAAARIKTPVMTLPLRGRLERPAAQELANRLRQLRLAECLKGITVTERPAMQQAPGSFCRAYEVALQFHHPAAYPKEAAVRWTDLAACFLTGFCQRLRYEVLREAKKKGATVIGKVELAAGDEAAQAAPRMTEEEAGEGGGEGGGSGRGRRKSEKADEDEDLEEAEEYQEGKLRFQGGRGEKATYDAPDEEDEEANAAARPDEEDDDVLELDGEGSAQQASSRRAASQKAAAGPGSQADAMMEAASKPLKGKAKAAAGAGLLNLETDIDDDNFLCRAVLRMPLTAPKLLMLELVEKAAALTMLRHTPGIEKCYVVTGQGGGPPFVQTDGINFQGVWDHEDIVDVTKVTTNDVGAVLRTYGVEAARATIMREVQSVFKAYGIGVDARHLGLIADFMTHQGGYRPCNRIGIESSTSPFLKMSFETAAHFLTDASLKCSHDPLKSPAASLCVGRVVELGTGCVDLIQTFPQQAAVRVS